MTHMDGKFEKAHPLGGYEEARDALERGDQEALRLLASEADTRAEMLYYLAENGESDIRALVAGNEATPHQADQVLASDEMTDVREALALKIARILPNLTDTDRTDIRERTLEILEKLAEDELPRIRAIVSEAVKENTMVPRSLVATLARDLAEPVSTPVLQYSPLLTDQDLKEIIAAGAASGRLKAIASRAELPNGISHDLVATLDEDAIAALLSNQSAHIREETLDAIIDHSAQCERLHEPLSARENLSLRAMKRISSFIASALVSRMVERSGLDAEVAEDVLAVARKAIQAERPDEDLEAKWRDQAKELIDMGYLDDKLIRALIKDNQRPVILHCLSLACDISYRDICTMFEERDARLITALAWKAGLSMRVSVALQRSIALINSNEILFAVDGIDYPLEDAAMDWLLASHTSE